MLKSAKHSVPVFKMFSTIITTTSRQEHSKRGRWKKERERKEWARGNEWMNERKFMNEIRRWRRSWQMVLPAQWMSENCEEQECMVREGWREGRVGTGDWMNENVNADELRRRRQQQQQQQQRRRQQQQQKQQRLRFASLGKSIYEWMAKRQSVQKLFEWVTTTTTIITTTTTTTLITTTTRGSDLLAIYKQISYAYLA